MGTEADHRWARNANRLRAQEHSHSPRRIELTRCGYRRRNAIVDSTQERGLLANQLQTVQNNEAICAIFQAAIWQSYRGRLRSWASGSISRNRRKADTLPERLHNKERRINLLVNRPSSRKKQSNTQMGLSAIVTFLPQNFTSSSSWDLPNRDEDNAVAWELRLSIAHDLQMNKLYEICE